jgi:transcriptional regulator with XRE-family HTH domain
VEPDVESVSEDDLLLGSRIREFRLLRQMSLRGLAEQAKASPSFLSQLERGQTSASIGTLRRIADALGVTVADLFDQGVAVGPRVLRRADRPLLHTGYGTRKYLVCAKPLQHMEAYVGEFESGGSTGDPYTHGDSQELLLVLKGSIRLVLGETPHELHAGDSIEYRSSTPHQIVNAADELAEVLWVISPPTPQ